MPGKRARATRADEAAATAMIGYLFDVLNLDRRWVIHIHRDRHEEDGGHGPRLAAVDPTYGRLDAALYLGGAWRTMSDEDQAQALVHEMLHLTHREVTDVVRLHLWEATAKADEDGDSPVPNGPLLYNALESTHRAALELMVDNLAWAFVRALPLEGIYSRFKKEAGA